MKVQDVPTSELYERGYRALLRELGPDGMVQFLCRIQCGKGDYTRDRHLWLDQLDFDEVCDSIIRRQEEAKAKAKATKRRRQRPMK